jgi:Phage tail lysozyme
MRARRRVPLSLLAFAAAPTVVVALVSAGALIHRLASDNCSNGTPTANVTAPQGNPATEAQFVHYFQSQGIPSNAAAGIVGNLYQESTLNPTEPGGGLAQWKPSWWASASAWITAHGQDPNSAGGQLMYIAANLTQDADGGEVDPGLKSQMYTTSSPQEAALVWMNDYEQCSGAGPRGTTSFIAGSLCEAPTRENVAALDIRSAPIAPAAKSGHRPPRHLGARLGRGSRAPRWRCGSRLHCAAHGQEPSASRRSAPNCVRSTSR